jgi:hypothetical protein
MRLPVQSDHVPHSIRAMSVNTGITAAMICFGESPPGSCCAQTSCPSGFTCRETLVWNSSGHSQYRISFCIANKFTTLSLG